MPMGGFPRLAFGSLKGTCYVFHFKRRSDLGAYQIEEL